MRRLVEKMYPGTDYYYDEDQICYEVLFSKFPNKDEKIEMAQS